MVRSASVTATPLPPIKEFTYEPAKQELFEEDDDDDEDDYNDDDNFFEDDDDEDEDDYDANDNFVEDEARPNGRENVGPLPSLYLIPYVYKRRFLHTQYGVRKDGDMFMIGDSPIPVLISRLRTECLRARRDCGNC